MICHLTIFPLFFTVLLLSLFDEVPYTFMAFILVCVMFFAGGFSTTAQKKIHYIKLLILFSFSYNPNNQKKREN